VNVNDRRQIHTVKNQRQLPEGLTTCAVNAKLEAPDTSGTTPLILAAALEPKKDPEALIVKALLDRKADPVLQDNNGYSVSIMLFPLIAQKGLGPRRQTAAQLGNTGFKIWFVIAVYYITLSLKA
jgi:hypothetical protein